MGYHKMRRGLSCFLNQDGSIAWSPTRQTTDDGAVRKPAKRLRRS